MAILSATSIIHRNLGVCVCVCVCVCVSVSLCVSGCVSARPVIEANLSEKFDQIFQYNTHLKNNAHALCIISQSTQPSHITLKPQTDQADIKEPARQQTQTVTSPHTCISVKKLRLNTPEILQQKQLSMPAGGSRFYYSYL